MNSCYECIHLKQYEGVGTGVSVTQPYLVSHCNHDSCFGFDEFDQLTGSILYKRISDCENKNKLLNCSDFKQRKYFWQEIKKSFLSLFNYRRLYESETYD